MNKSCRFQCLEQTVHFLYTVPLIGSWHSERWQGCQREISYHWDNNRPQTLEAVERARKIIFSDDFCTAEHTAHAATSVLCSYLKWWDTDLYIVCIIIISYKTDFTITQETHKSLFYYVSFANIRFWQRK